MNIGKVLGKIGLKWPHEQIIRQLAEVLAELKELNRKVDVMVQEFTNLEEAVAKIEADAVNIAVNVQATRELVVALQEEVARLLAIIEAGGLITPEQIQAVANRVNAVDTALDAIVPDVPV